MRETPAELGGGGGDLSPAGATQQAGQVGDGRLDQGKRAKSGVAGCQGKAAGGAGRCGFVERLLAGGAEHARILGAGLVEAKEENADGNLCICRVDLDA